MRGDTSICRPPSVIVAVRRGRSVFTILLIDTSVRVCASREIARDGQREPTRVGQQPEGDLRVDAALFARDQ